MSVTKGKALANEVVALLKARSPLIWVVTSEEARVERHLFDASAAAKYVPYTWDCGQGISNIAGDIQDDTYGTPDIGDTLGKISIRSKTKIASTDTNRAVWILRDASEWLQGPGGMQTKRQLRNLVRTLPSAPKNTAQAVIIISTSAEVPAELRDDTVIVEWALPDRQEIGEIIDRAIRSLPEALRDDAAPNGAREAAIDAAIGLTEAQAGACYAKSLVLSRKIDSALVSTEKRSVISKLKALEWTDVPAGGLSDVGGLDVLKSWVEQRKAAYSKEAREYGLKAPKGVFLVGVQGCLAEGTSVSYKRGKRKSGRYIKIEDLYHKFNGQYDGYACQDWRNGVDTYIQSWDIESGKIFYNKVNNVIKTGVKVCFRIFVGSAGSVELTEDHPVLCADGLFKDCADLKVGDQILVKGSMKPTSSGKNRIYRKRTIVEGLKYHPVAWKKSVRSNDNTYTYGRITKARLVVEAQMNSVSYVEFVRILKEDQFASSNFNYLPSDYDVHHADENPLNDDINNLVVTTHEDHACYHALSLGNFGVEYTKVVSIIETEIVGWKTTYDVSMDDGAPNLVVNNGIIVHNCGKSLSVKGIASALGMPIIRLDLGALKAKFVGDSEANIRNAFKVIDSVGRCVVWLDEIEKALQGAVDGGADGGVSGDALGTFLTWMQERKGEAFVVATSNDISKIPPEVYRKGRFDEVFFVDLPNYVERMEILAITIKLAGRDTKKLKIDLKEVAKVTDTFTGSEVAELVNESLFVAFSDAGREINTKDLVKAASAVVPLAKTAEQKIKTLRDWAKGRARFATSKEGEKNSTVVDTGPDLDL